CARAERLDGDLLQRAAEGVEAVSLDRAARRHRVAAEAQQQAGLALADEVERVAQVKAFDRSPGPLQRAVAADREDEGRTMQPVLETRRDDADDALVERRVEHRERRFELAGERERAVDTGVGVLAHPRLDRAPLAVDLVEQRSELVGAAGIVGEQALDAER